jgi:hypothetical protein
MVIFPGLDLREIEDVVDDRHQALGRGPDGADEIALLVVELRLREEIGHADDAVHRRPDLVRHVGEELGLEARGRERLVARRRELLLAAPALDGYGREVRRHVQESELGVGGPRRARRLVAREDAQHLAGRRQDRLRPAALLPGRRAGSFAQARWRGSPRS